MIFLSSLKKVKSYDYVKSKLLRVGVSFNKKIEQIQQYSDRITRGLKSQQKVAGEVMDASLNLVDVKDSAYFLEQARILIDK